MEEKITTDIPKQEDEKIATKIPSQEDEKIATKIPNQEAEEAEKPTTDVSRQVGKKLTSQVDNILDSLSSKTPYIVVFSLILLLAMVFFWNNIVISIHAGEGGVLYRRLFGGTVMDYVYPEGIHILFPWDIMTIYNARVQLIKHEFDVLSNKGLPIHLNIAVRFRPQYDLLPVLHQQIGPDYVDKIIIPQIESVLRKNIGQYDPEDIYTNKQGVLSNIIVLALEETGRKYVQVDEIMIRSLELPPSIRTAIEEKLTYEQQAKAYGYRLIKEEQEAKRKRVEAKGIAEYQEIISQNLSNKLLTWQGIHATNELARSDNAKIVVIGGGPEGLPVILGGVDSSSMVKGPNPPAVTQPNDNNSSNGNGTSGMGSEIKGGKKNTPPGGN